MVTKIIIQKDEKGVPLLWIVKHPTMDFKFNSYYLAKKFRDNYDFLNNMGEKL